MAINTKRILLLTVIFLGLFFSAKLFFHIEKENFLKLYIICSVIFLVVAILINLSYNLIFINKMKEANKHIDEKKEIEIFIEKMEKINNQYRGKIYKNLIFLNLSYGYIAKNRYEDALNVLNKIDEKKLKYPNKSIFTINKCATLFYLGHYEEFITFRRERQKDIDDLKSIKQLEWNLKCNDIFFEISLGNYEKARKMLEISEEKWTEDKMVNDWNKIRDILESIDVKDKSENDDVQVLVRL